MSSDFENVLAVLNPSVKERAIISWLSDEVGDRVADKLQSLSVDAEPYDIVGESVSEVLEEFESSNDYDIIQPFIAGRFNALIDVLKFGYGSPEEIFADYREIIS